MECKKKTFDVENIYIIRGKQYSVVINRIMLKLRSFEKTV